MPLPFDRVYRAFPELNRFSNEQCRRFVARAQRRHPVATALSAAAALAATAGGWAMIAVGWSALARALPADWSRAVSVHEMGVIAWMIVLVVCMTVGPLCGLSVRWLCVRWLVRRHLNRAVCPRCRTSILGRPLEPGAEPTVACQRCGASVPLAARGLCPEDVIAAAPHGAAMVGG